MQSKITVFVKGVQIPGQLYIGVYGLVLVNVLFRTLKNGFNLVRSGDYYKLNAVWKKIISTVNSTVEFITVIMAVVNTIASVAVWDTFAVATGE